MSGPEFDSVREHLRALAGADAAREASPEVERALLASFRQHTADQASRRAFGVRSFWPVWALAGAAAAALAWVAVRGVTSSPAPPVLQPAPPAVAVRNAPPPAPVVIANESPAAVPVARQASRKIPAGARSSRRVAESAEPATRYYALAPDVDEATIERLPSVRVRMPRSVLASFGLPVDADRLNQPVKADVVLGEDGMARAIRFVSSPAYR